MVTDEDILIAFFTKHPEMLGWRGKSFPDINTSVGQETIRQKYRDSKNKILELKTPLTIPDSAVSVLLQATYHYSDDEVVAIKNQHLQSMAAENMVGELLERYIDQTLSSHGWVRCWGEIVKSIDFIKIHNGDFVKLQIKNRDNSENSSSKAIREGTDILHWFRTFSRTGKTNWDAFPDSSCRHKLSEEGFEKYIKITFNPS